MNKISLNNRVINSIWNCKYIFILCIFLFSCSTKDFEGYIVAVEVSDDNPDLNENTTRSRIILIDQEDTENPAKVLTDDFYAANSVQVSYDGKKILFSGKKSTESKWQIWEMELRNKKAIQITNCQENCTDPSYMPLGKFAFSREIMNEETGKSMFTLFTGKLDGTNIKQITFYPYSNFATTMLEDGRFITVNKQVLQEQESATYYVMRPDGTKALLYYTGDKGSKISGRAWETAGGPVYFIECSKMNNNRCSVISVHRNRPLNTRKNHSEGINGDFRSVFATKTGKCIVTYRSEGSENYGVYHFDAEHNSLGEQIYTDPGYHILDAVVVEKIERPRDLPSAVDLSKETGLLLCQDINFTGMPVQDTNKKACKIELLGYDESYGIVDVENDGSVYMKLKADIPFRIRTLDKNNKIIHGPSAWIYIRPNERRGCIGCHENQEMVPKNIVPLAVKKEPVMMSLNSQ